MEKGQLKVVSKDALLGKVFGFIFVVLALVTACYFAYQGHEEYAAVLGTGTIASVVWAFTKNLKT